MDNITTDSNNEDLFTSDDNFFVPKKKEKTIKKIGKLIIIIRFRILMHINIIFL